MSDGSGITRGAHHIALTVPDLRKARTFYLETLGYEQIGEKPDYPAFILTDGTTLITLWQAVDPDNCMPFDLKNVIDLHHFALPVDNHAALDDLYETLKEAPDVEIEFAPESLGGSDVRHMMTYIPGGIRVEILSRSA